MSMQQKLPKESQTVTTCGKFLIAIKCDGYAKVPIIYSLFRTEQDKARVPVAYLSYVRGRVTP